METTTVIDHLAGLDGPLREIGEQLLPVEPALFTDWLRQAKDLEAK
ncbi:MULTISPECIES: hypothetical protein [unclassified Micromonospora]